MKYIIKLEEFGMLALSVAALYYFKVPWWIYLLLPIAPDINMLGYLGGNKTGAFFYNIFHHKGIAIACFLTGILTGNHILIIAGIVLFGHSSFDRLMGYGLKYSEGF